VRKKSILTGMMVVVFSLFAVAPVIADETAEPKQAEKERLELIQASQEMAEEEKALPQKRFVLYAVGLDSEYEKVNLGGRFELNLLPTTLRIGLEGVELERGKPVVGFFSLMLALFHRTISPYVGIGTEIGLGVETDEGNRNKRYQLFAGVEIGDNFFLEVKYVNEKDINTGIAEIYSVAGFKISF